MTQNLIPVKYIDDAGVHRIRNGMKANRNAEVALERKPPWIRVRATASGRYAQVCKAVHQHRLATVCEEAMCPNISECWGHGTATLMLLGEVCTRACKFCAVDTGNPKGRLNEREPEAVAESVALMGLDYVVLTSVNRDDLPDGGADQYAKAVEAIIRRCPDTQVEALVPDFQGNLDAVERVVNSGICVFAQNMETVERLTHQVRDIRAGYDQTLKVLQHASRYKPGLLTKTSLILGLGENHAEIEQTMDDLRVAEVDILTLGQYLRPTRNHLPVARWVSPEEFDNYRELGLAKGFAEVVSGPLVRSSYRAERAVQNLI